jgi:hypothetical protein
MVAYTLADLASDIIHNHLWNIPSNLLSIAKDIMYNDLWRLSNNPSTAFADEIFHNHLRGLEATEAQSLVGSSESGLLLWLKSDTGVVSAGSNVLSMADQSEFGNNTVFYPTEFPIVVEETINGYPAISIRGQTESLLIPTTNFDQAFSGQSVPLVAFIVMKFCPYGGTLAGQPVYFGASITDSYINFMIDNEGVSPSFARFFLQEGDDHDNAYNVYSDYSIPVNQWVVAEFVNHGLTTSKTISQCVEMAINGTPISVDVVNSTAPASFGVQTFDPDSYQCTISIGGYLAEMKIYNTDLSSEERTIIRNGLLSKYGLGG